MDMLQPLSTPSTTITLTDLNISTDYTVYVAATTVAGVGPADVAVVMTLNDSKAFLSEIYIQCTSKILWSLNFPSAQLVVHL